MQLEVLRKALPYLYLEADFPEQTVFILDPSLPSVFNELYVGVVEREFVQWIKLTAELERIKHSLAYTTVGGYLHLFDKEFGLIKGFEDLKNTTNTMNNKLDKMTGTLDKMNGTLTSISTGVNKLNTSFEQLNTSFEQLNTSFGQMNETISKLVKHLTDQNKQ